MEKGFLDKVEDNAAVRTWSEITQREKGDSLDDGYVSKLWDFTRISLFHIWKGRFGANDRRICGFTSMFKVSSR
ncbi:hypothetical protein Golax_000018 [Gossypium laxum]|uniref:Uncharacterized protein n=1 Tax=Gossypium laxum TaxID=34288 RepID=A0A7J9AZV8_9ROSI|nr:hypothetical protein [Gossypium laxum]